MTKTLPIITALGGRKATQEALNAEGYPIKTTDPIRMWEKRGSIPGEPAVLLIKIAEERGIEWDKSDFFRESSNG